MSVYTAVSTAELEAWLTRYAVGTLVEQAPIASGIENTNYFVTTTRGRFVLTLFERLPADELPFYLNLMAHLARAGVACPAPAPDRTGALFSMLNGKPAGLTQRIDGAPIVVPDAPHCAAVGDALARLHLASASYRSRLGNRRGPAWWRQAARAVRPFLDRRPERAAGRRAQAPDRVRQDGDAARARSTATSSATTSCSPATAWPASSTSASPRPTSYAYDLAITVNDWCIVKEGAERGTLEPGRVSALLDGYQAVRPLDADEREQWPSLLRAAALRFWLSRLYDLHLPRPGELVHAHDPAALRAHPARPHRAPGAGSRPSPGPRDDGCRGSRSRSRSTRPGAARTGSRRRTRC